MSMENVIEVKDLCVDYKELDSYSIKKMFLRGKKARKEDFHAVKHVSFDVAKGEILGVIGKNGSGKSTLLRTIGGIFSPTSGEIDLHGHSVSLLSIGVGFNRQISGRENIILSGMLLGFSKQEVLDKMDEIIAFSELGDFIDKPVRTYSSGMYSKLAFSVTVILQTEIMLIDEVLSVGDEYFRTKSLEKMTSLINDDERTVIIVSHSIQTLQELCTRVMWMHDGEIRQIGDPKEVLAEYKKFMKYMKKGDEKEPKKTPKKATKKAPKKELPEEEPKEKSTEELKEAPKPEKTEAMNPKPLEAPKPEPTETLKPEPMEVLNPEPTEALKEEQKEETL